MSRGSIPDQFVFALSELRRVFPDVSNDHPDFWENIKMREIAGSALMRGIDTALQMCDVAESIRMRRERAGKPAGEVKP